MRLTRFVAPALFLAMLAGAGTSFAQYYGQPGPPPPGYGQGGPGGWDTYPREFREVQQRGFRDGIEGARRDFENRRPPNVMNRDEFRNPKFIPGPDRRMYKMGFQRGYDVGVRHFYGPGGRPY